MKNTFCFVFLLFSGIFIGSSQAKYEREFRIKKSQFPENALLQIRESLKEAKRIKFYKEIDSAKTSFEAKFKKDKLWYSIEFDKEGILEDIEILIKEIDIPSDTFKEISNYLKTKYSKYRIKKIQQQYPYVQGEHIEETLKNAFQNLLLPTINYELIVAGKKDKNYYDYEILFDANGKYKSIRRSLPPNYDHVLY
jgi:signal recognition particle GTPase